MSALENMYNAVQGLKPDDPQYLKTKRQYEVMVMGDKAIWAPRYRGISFEDFLLDYENQTPQRRKQRTQRGRERYMGVKPENVHLEFLRNIGYWKYPDDPADETLVPFKKEPTAKQQSVCWIWMGKIGVRDKQDVPMFPFGGYAMQHERTTFARNYAFEHYRHEDMTAEERMCRQRKFMLKTCWDFCVNPWHMVWGPGARTQDYVKPAKRRSRA